MRVGGTIPNVVSFEDLDVSVAGCTEPLCFTQVYFARMELCLMGADGNVCICLETSIDGTKWIPHNECSKILLKDEDTGIKVGFLDGLFYRVCVKADEMDHTATTGTLKTRMLLKDT